MNKWGTEESHALSNQSGLVYGQQANIMIVAGADEWDIILNGMPYCKYKYRYKLEYNTHILVEGQIKPHSLLMWGPHPDWDVEQTGKQGNDSAVSQKRDNNRDVKTTEGLSIVTKSNTEKNSADMVCASNSRLMDGLQNEIMEIKTSLRNLEENMEGLKFLNNLIKNFSAHKEEEKRNNKKPSWEDFVNRISDDTV